jgi:hypothetical protein
MHPIIMRELMKARTSDWHRQAEGDALGRAAHRARHAPVKHSTPFMPAHTTAVLIRRVLTLLGARRRSPRIFNKAQTWARRRRLAALTASAVAGAAAIAAAVLLPSAAHGPAHGQPPSRPASQQASAAPIHLRSPIQFRQVAAITGAPCPAGSGGLPGSLPGSRTPACFRLTGTGMTVTTVRSAQVTQFGAGGYVIELDLTPAQTSRFATLTGQLSGLPSPRDQLAAILGGRVIDHPEVQGTITGGQALIFGFATRAQAESLLSYLRSR